MTKLPEDPDSTTSEPTITSLPAMAGLKLLGDSFSIFGKNPSIWVVMLVVYIVIILLITSIPFFVLLPILLAPIFNAGFIYGARVIDEHKMLEIDHLFAGFKLQLRGLFRLGMIYFLLNLIIIAMLGFFQESTADQQAIIAMIEADPALELEQVIRNNPQLAIDLFKSLFLGVILSIPLVMASWFAPALVLFNQQTPLKAMLLSIRACNKNILAFLVYGVLVIPLFILALIPFGLGLLVMMPVMFIGQYCSYKMIFNQTNNNQSVFIV